MDEISMVTALQPRPAASEDQMYEAARTRFTAALGGSPPPRRTWQRRPVLLAGGALAAAAAAAIVLPATLPGGTASTFVTAAWAVQRNPDGTVKITFKDYRDPAGLQRALAKAGVRARVVSPPEVVRKLRNGGTESYPSCNYDVTGSFLEPPEIQQAVATKERGPHMSVVIHPAAMPAGSLLFIEDTATYSQGSTDISGTSPVVLKSDRLPPCTPFEPPGL